MPLDAGSCCHSQVTADSLPHNGNDLTSMPDQQTGMRVQVCGFCHGLLAGQVVGGATSSAGVLVKMGFSSQQQSLALFLEYPWTAAYQVCTWTDAACITLLHADLSMLDCSLGAWCVPYL